MAESLGGSRRRDDGSFRLGLTQASRTGGGILDRPATARNATPARTGNMAALLGPGGSRGRPSSAPRDRAPVNKSLEARQRVEELRQVKEAQFWGRESKDTIRANQRDLPAFWSVREHGQPFNDERLASGATNLFRLKQPTGLSGPGDPLASAQGPATLQQAALRKSLETGRRHFSSLSDLAPLPQGAIATETLTDAEREFLLNRLTPYQRIHALHHCLDKNPATVFKDWMPWPLAILNRETLSAEREGRKTRPPKYDQSDWHGGPAQRDMLMRLAIGELEHMMRRHLKFMSERACSASRAPSAMEKDILRQAFWRVDPQKTGTVSVQQFLQVWQNLLRLMEYDDVWVKGKDIKGKTKQNQALRPKRTILLDRNMAAALFVKYGFDKDGLMPYVVYINTLCETPSRLLGHDIVLDKHGRGKNGLEDDLDIAMCLGNAKIEYRFCKSGVFPPAEFTAAMGRRSFKPPKAHMWLEHVYGYSGMLQYTRQSNVFYTHNTGQPLNPHTASAVQRALLAGQGAAPGTELRPEQNKRVEFVYYTGSVGIVFDKEKYDAGLPCQRYFFGHNNDIQCLAIHPNRKWVATGQQKCTGKSEVPYVCVWDTDHCMQLQRLDHDVEERAVIAVAFSGDILEGQGGELLLTVTSDDKHTIHVWRWLPHSNKYINAHFIPGWYFGPEKKIRSLRLTQTADGGLGDMYFNNPYGLMEGEHLDDYWLSRYPFDLDNWRAACSEPGKGETGHGIEYDAVQSILEASRKPVVLERPAWEGDEQWWTRDPLPYPNPGCETGPCGLWSPLEHPDMRVRSDDADGLYMCMRHVKREDGFVQPGVDEEKLKMPHLEQTLLGCNGTPPMVYGLVWNRLRPSTGRRGSEFASYGVKHLRVWIANDEGRFIGTPGSFGSANIENILSAVYVPAMHPMRSPGDSCILTGFASGKLGMWLPPYPTRAGATYTLIRHITAHGLGKTVTLSDGTQVNGGVRALSLRKAAGGALEVLSGGADGQVKRWRLEEVSGAREDGAPIKGVKLSKTDECFNLAGPPSGTRSSKVEPPLVVALDCHEALDKEFLAGTDMCNIWEVDLDPRILVEGHEKDLDEVAAHPEELHTFATACSSGKCRVWDARRRDVAKSADLGYKLTGIAYSQEQLSFTDESKRRIFHGYHLAVGGDRGELTVMRSDTLQPLVHRNDVASKQALPEMKYSPPGGPRMLAAASSDQTIYIYRADRNYQLLCRCVGHSTTVSHVDWSLPVQLPGTPHDGKFLLQSCDLAGDLLYWDPATGRKLPYNMRNAEWHSWTLTVGFDVMGIWPDGSDGSDVNALDRCRLGAPIYDPFEAEYEGSTAAAMHLSERDSADGVSGASFLVTADDFCSIKLFNYPVVADDAPFKAFRGHASHVTCARFLADDRLMVSVGGADRGIFQWRTCGVASGLPPLPIIHNMLAEATRKAANPDAAKEARDAVWDRLQERARAFRSYERLKLFAARVAVEEKRVNSADAGKPQPKLPEQLVWGKLPGTVNQYGPVPRSALQSAAGGGTAIGSPAKVNTPRMTPRGPSVAPSPRNPSPATSVPATPRTAVAASPPAAATSVAASDDYEGYEPTVALSPHAAASPAPSVSGGVGAGVSTPRSESRLSGSHLTGAGQGTPPKAVMAPAALQTGVGGRSGKRYVTDSIADDGSLVASDDIPEDGDF